MNKFWKIVIPLICLLVVIATAVVIVYLYWPAIKGTLDGSKYYTEEDIKASYNKGYDEASKLLNELQEQVNYYKKQIDDYNKQLYSLIPEVDRLREDKKINLEKISFLEKQVKKFEEQIISFNETIEDLNKQLKFFQNNSESSIIELQNLRFEKQNLQNQCDNYIIRINELNDTLNYYKELINSNVNDNECTISFCVDDFIYDTIIVNKNSTFNIPNIPTKNNYKFGYDNEEIFTFKGWSIDGQNVIDLSEYVVNENTTFYALFDTTFKYDLICVNNTISDYTIEIENTKSTINEFEITLNSFKTLFVYDNIDYLKVRNIVTSLYNSFYSKFSVSSGHYWTWDTYIYDYDYYLFFNSFYNNERAVSYFADLIEQYDIKYDTRLLEKQFSDIQEQENAAYCATKVLVFIYSLYEKFDYINADCSVNISIANKKLLELQNVLTLKELEKQYIMERL